jgi:hypothetical protein
MVSHKKKPIDRWLGFGAAAMSIALFFLSPQNPIIIIVLLIVMAAFLVHPIWNFWWIDRSLFRRMVCLLAMATLLFRFGYYVWPKPYSQMRLAAFGFKEPHPANSTYDGITWQSYLVDVRLRISNDGDKIVRNLQIEINPGIHIVHIGQTSQIPQVSFEPISPTNLQMLGLMALDKNGNKESIPASSNGSIVPSYRMTCFKLLPKNKILVSSTLKPYYSNTLFA